MTVDVVDFQAVDNLKSDGFNRRQANAGER